MDLKTFRETNTQIVGPTRYGKGVLLGALAEQSIQLGHSFIYVDPKDDKWLPWILYQTAAPAQKRFVVIDLNGDKTGWHPFVGGELRDRRERIVSACGLYSAGTDADYYKRMERGILDRILPTSPGTIRSLLDALEALDGDDVPRISGTYLAKNTNRKTTSTTRRRTSSTCRMAVRRTTDHCVSTIAPGARCTSRCERSCRRSRG